VRGGGGGGGGGGAAWTTLGLVPQKVISHSSTTLASLRFHVTSFTLKMTNHHIPILTFRVYDYDVGSANDEMGQVKIDLLKDLQENTIMDKWHKITPSPDCMDATGSLSISISYSLVPPPMELGSVEGNEMKDFRGGKVSENGWAKIWGPRA
jgi:hypothetical protein